MVKICKEEKRMKKFFTIFAALLLTVSVLSACGSKESSGNGKERTVKIGINGDDYELWNIVQKQVKSEGIKLKIISFSDYVQPNIS